MDVQQRVADVIAAHEVNYTTGNCRCGKWELGETHASHVSALILTELSQEERWVPIAETGERWAPRSREHAESAMWGWPAGGCYEGSDDPYDGVVRLDREVRLVSDWHVVESIDSLTYSGVISAGSGQMSDPDTKESPHS